MSEGGGGGDGGGGYPGQGPTPSSTVPDQQDSKSGLPPFSSFGEMDPVTGRINTDGEALQTSRLLDISSWDYYGEGLTGRLLDRGDGFPMLIPQPQYRPWESKDHPDFPGSPLNKLPSFQSQFTAFPQDQNGDTVLTTLTPAPASPNSSSSGLPSFHTLSTVPPRGYPLVPAPVQAREIPSIQQQILDERHIHLFQGAPHQQYHQLGAYQPQQQATLLTVVKTEPLIVTQLQSGYDHHQDLGVKMEDANSPRGYLDSRKKERRKIRASSMESSNESDGVGSSSVESSGQVAAISSTAGFKSPLACHQPNMHSEDDMHDMSDKPVKKKRKRCGECIGCQRKDNCGDCAPCRNDKSHQICKMRRCEKLTEKKHLLYLNHDYPRGERGRGRGKGRGGARGKRSGFGTSSVAPSDSYRKLHQTSRSPLASPNLQLNGGVDSNNMMPSIPDHAAVRGETKIEPQVTQTNLPPITGATMPLYSSSVQPGMEPGGFTTPLRDHRFGNPVWQPAAAPPDPNGSWAPQGQFIQQIPPQIEEIRYPQYAVSGYPQATPVVGYQQNSFMQANGNLYNGTAQPQPSPHSMHNGNSRSTPTLNGNMEYVEQSPRPSEYMNGTYPHSNQPDVMAPPTSSTPTSRCGSAHLENGEGKYTNPPTPTTPSNQGNAMPGYPLQIPPQSVQSSHNSSGYPGQVNESAERGNNGENNNAKSNDKELWSSSPRPSDSTKDEVQQLDNHLMHKSSDTWGEGRNGSSQGSAQSVWSTPGSDISTSQHQQQESWPSSPQQVSQSMQHQQQQQQQQLQEAQNQRFQQHHQQQMNQAQMQHPQKSPQMSKDEQQQIRHQQPSPQMHQPPTSTQSQHMRMQQQSPMMSQHQMQQQVQMHQQQAQQQAQMHQQSQSQQQEQIHQQQLAQMRQQNQMHHQQSQNSQQPLQIQLQQSHSSLHHQQLPSPVHQQHPHIQQNQMSHHNMQGHHGSQSLHMMQHQNVQHHHQQLMGGQGSSPQHREMWSGQPNSRPPSQNPPEPWPNESANQQQMWANDKKSNQFERAELNNRLKTMILNKQQQEIKKIHDGGHLGYQDQKNLPPVSSGNFLALGHHPRKLVSEGGGFRSGGSSKNDGLHAMENIVNSVKCPENFVYGNTQPGVQPESFLKRMTSAKFYQVSSQTQTSSQTLGKTSSQLSQSRRRSPSPVSPQKIKQEPQWDEKQWGSSVDPGRSPQQLIKDQVVKTEIDASFDISGIPFEEERLKAVKEESFDSDPSKEYSFDEGDFKTEEDIKLSPEPIDRLKSTVRGEVPACDCFPPDHIPAEPGPYYTHLGYAKSLEELRDNIEKRTGFVGKAIRIEKVIFTGKEGKTTSGCPLGKWIIRRSGPEEKVLVVVKNRKGHVCATSWIVIVTVAWEGVPAAMADDLYTTVTDKLRNYGVVTSRRCGVNEPRTCACQGLDNTTCGASFSFGCSWSMYYNGCKFARSKTARKFKLSVKTEVGGVQEQCMEDKLQNLATYLSPVYKTMAPDSFANMTEHEEEAVDCRLGLQPGRPWSGVTACFDFCAHAHRDIHNMNNGCTTVVTLTKHRGFEKPSDEQLHVLPLYVIDESDEQGTKEGYLEKVQSGAIEVLTKYPCEVRTRQTPLESCRKLAKKRKDEREHAKRALAYKMTMSSLDYSSPSPQTTNHNDFPVRNGLNTTAQQSYLNYPAAPEKRSKAKGMSLYHQPSELCRSDVESMSQMMRSPQQSMCPPSPFRSPLRVVTQSPGAICAYSAPSTPERDTCFSPAASPNSVFRRPVGRPPSRSSNPATPQPHIDSTYLKPNKIDSLYSQGMDSDRNFYHSVLPHSPNYQQPYSPVSVREQTSPLPSIHSFMTPIRDGFASKNTAFNTYVSQNYESQSAPVSPVSSTAGYQRPNYSSGIHCITSISSPVSRCSSVSTQCSPSRSPYPTTVQAPSPSLSQSSGYWSGSQSDIRETFFPRDHPTIPYTPPKWCPMSRHSRFTPSPSSATFSTPTTPTYVSSQQSLPSFQDLTGRKIVDQTDFAWSSYSPVSSAGQDQCWKPVDPPIQKSIMSQHYPGSRSYQIEQPLEMRSPVQSPNKQWARESETPPSHWNGPSQAPPRTPDVEPQNLLGSVTDFSNNEDCFLDPSVGGVAIALCHGAVLFEVAKHELHATTALKNPNRFHPTRISLVFYQHRNLNKSDHGRGEWREKQRCKKELAEKHAEMAERASEIAENAAKMEEKSPTMASIATQSLDTQTEPHSVGTSMDSMPYNYFPEQPQPPSPMLRYSPMVPTSSNPPSPASQMQSVPTPSAWGNLFPLHPSVVQGPYQESETLG